ncbi:hypothetical protein M569_03999, partial [Genlisea aurea]
MSALRGICRPQVVFSSVATGWKTASRISIAESPNCSSNSRFSVFAGPYDGLGDKRKGELRSKLNRQKRMVATKASSNWTESKSPYETLELESDADVEQIKVAYRRLAKFYHPDVYDGRGTLDEGETAEARFIKVQAAYELLVDSEKRRQYDIDNRVNPMKASEAWMEWLMKKRKAFDQRGDMAIAAWAEQQQRELNLRARRLARSKVDPEEERKILVKERKAFAENLNNTLRRHTLVLKKRDLMRKKSKEDTTSKIIGQLLAAEGLELDDNDKDE